MAKLHATEIQHRPCRGPCQGRRPAQRGPFLAAFIVLLVADATQTRAQAWGGFPDGPARRLARWSVSISNDGGARAASAKLAAVRTWTLHGALHRRPPAALTIRCGEGAKLSVYVSFPERAWKGDAVLHYTLRPAPPRPIPPSFRRQQVGAAERLGMAEWLGGPDLVREIARAEALHVAIEDLGFGTSEAVFHLAGAEDAVRRVEGACRQGGEAPAPSASSPRPGERTGAPPLRSAARTEEDRQPRTPPTKDARSRSQAAPPPTATPPERRANEQHAPSPGIVEDERRAPSPQPQAGPDGASETRRGNDASSPSQNAPEQADRETPPASPPPAATQARPAPAPLAPTEPPLPAPAPEHREPDRGSNIPESREIPADAPKSMPGRVAGLPAEPPPVSPALPPAREDEPREDARLRLFLQRHGPNRRGEIIYDWHKQCLEHVGVDPRQTWYLSNDELTYLDKGTTDRVRLSMLISTDRDLDVPPRRITCYGTAQGRELTIDKTE